MTQKKGPSEIWEETLDKIKSCISSDKFNTWFKRTKGIAFDGEVLTIEATRGKFHADYLSANFKELISSNLQYKFYIVGSENIELTKEPVNEVIMNQAKTAKTGNKVVANQLGTIFNKRYTFDNFIVGKSNEFACAAAKAVSQNLAMVHNPLVIYGGTGLGKTHLMQAIGNDIISQQPYKKVVYLPTETLVSDFVYNMQKGRMDEVKKRYRSIEVLLLDDVQFLAGKERSEMEFFHTFNALYQSDKQIVLTCDRIPQETNLQERLISRLANGLMVDIKPPDFETRMAILLNKANWLNLKLPYAVAAFLAESIATNIRDLEGCLSKIHAYSYVKKTNITIELVQEILQDMLKVSKTHFKIDDIIVTACDYFHIPVEALKSPSRKQDIAHTRKIIMYLATQYSGLKLQEIAKTLNRADHTTIIHGRDFVKNSLQTDREIERDVEEIIIRLKRVK
ncbi:MAG: chromosomal replication initiator protein DnaA [Candidatus Coatesbacteria bacterium]|nr:chromosomal replication initiator protein DnaA [Candidatus Coatesbacteria bacterium]